MKNSKLTQKGGYKSKKDTKRGKYNKPVLSMLAWLLIALCALSAHADAIEDFANSPAINADKAAVLITDLKTGKTLAAHNETLPLIPASIMKCVTTATLLEAVGHDFGYETDVYTTGKVNDGTLHGDLLINASGDPSLNSKHLPEGGDFPKEIAEALRRKGIRTIEGTIRIDESVFSGPAVNPTWASGDLPHAYGTGSHGLNFEDNATGSRSVSNPASVFRSRLKNALASKGVKVTESEDASTDSHRRKLLTHRSPDLEDIMRSCMMRSDNQYAEALLRTTGHIKGKEGSADAGAEYELNYWKRHKAPTDGVKIVDGSGLSRSNRMTARFMTHVLRNMARDPWYASFFPLAGQEGTLKKFLAGTPLDSYVAMKTGSMNGIQCYAGYLLDDDYAPTHTIVVMLNEMGNRAAAREQISKLILKLFADDNTED